MIRLNHHANSNGHRSINIIFNPKQASSELFPPSSLSISDCATGSPYLCRTPGDRASSRSARPARGSQSGGEGRWERASSGATDSLSVFPRLAPHPCLVLSSLEEGTHLPVCTSLRTRMQPPGCTLLYDTPFVYLHLKCIFTVDVKCLLSVCV